MSTYSLVYRTTYTLTVGSTGVVDDGNGAFHKDFTLPSPVKVGSTFLNQAVRERRINDSYGATAELVDDETVRVRWFEALINDETTGLDEIIQVHVEVYDLSAIGDDLKELLFKSARILGYLGENVMQDLLHYDDAGNITQYRLRVFDTRAHCEAATPDIVDGSELETGESARVTMNQDIDIGKNDRALLLRVLTDIIATPGIG